MKYGIAKEIALCGTFVALLIGAQFALSFVSGVEIVTALLVSFCYALGVKRGVIVGVSFSLLRCFIFGFFPSVVIEYLIYYTLFAVVFGLLGKMGKLDVKKYIVVVFVALVMTAVFTALDNVITPLFYGLDEQATVAYHASSVITLLPQLVCTFITTTVLVKPLTLCYEKTGLVKAMKVKRESETV